MTIETMGKWGKGDIRLIVRHCYTIEVRPDEEALGNMKHACEGVLQRLLGGGRPFGNQ